MIVRERVEKSEKSGKFRWYLDDVDHGSETFAIRLDATGLQNWPGTIGFGSEGNSGVRFSRGSHWLLGSACCSDSSFETLIPRRDRSWPVWARGVREGEPGATGLRWEGPKTSLAEGPVWWGRTSFSFQELPDEPGADLRDDGVSVGA